MRGAESCYGFCCLGRGEKRRLLACEEQMLDRDVQTVYHVEIERATAYSTGKV